MCNLESNQIHISDPFIVSRKIEYDVRFGPHVHSWTEEKGMLEKGEWKKWDVGPGQPKLYGLSVGKRHFSKEKETVLGTYMQREEWKPPNDHALHSFYMALYLLRKGRWLQKSLKESRKREAMRGKT